METKKYCKRLIANEIRREINVYVGDMTKTDQHYDLVLCSAFKNVYKPINQSFIESLYHAGVNVDELARSPEKNGKDFGFWISKKVDSSFFDRLCCFEFAKSTEYGKGNNYRAMFDFFITLLAYDTEYNFKSIATPILGTKNVGLTKKQVVPIILQTALQCFANNNSLKEFSVYCMDNDTADFVNSSLITLLKKPHDVFISYPHAKEADMLELTTILEKNKLRVWNDKKGLKGGDMFDDIIATAIDQSKIFLFLWYEETEASNYCCKELEYALDLNKKVIPYRCSKKLDGNTNLGKKIGKRNWLDSSKCNYESLVCNIVSVLRDVAITENVGVSEE